MDICIVISDGYYEWKSIEGKIPYFVFCSDKSIMPMAGLCKWDANEWEKKLVYTIITKKREINSKIYIIENHCS